MKSNRRKFLQSTLSVPAALALGRPGARPWGAALLPAGPMIFSNPDVIRYDAQCFTLHGRDTFLHGGSFHYSRCPQPLWEDRLFKLKRAGFNVIETYVFWNYHEPVEGQADLSEFESFIRLAGQMGFWLIARVGPYGCGEWDGGGFPHWVTAMQFTLRSDDPQSIKTSRHWLNLVLPVIKRHQITVGGPIIMMQIENEYDFWKSVPDAQKRAYLSALAETAWDGGINVPLITCWTHQARENSYPDMARIADFCNLYPRWHIMKQVPPALETLRREEPSSPVGMTELQGGWLSKFGGKLAIDQEGLGPDQLPVLTKTVIEYGVTFYNYYMGFGGTNFEWAAKDLTTTYDYAAPVREPGGLWGKYYEARALSLFLEVCGPTLTRARKQEGAAQSSSPAVSVTERVNGKSGVLFVRENADAAQQFKLTFRDPASPAHRNLTVPREGQLSLAPREMKMMALQVPVAGTTLCYSTAEVLARGVNLDRPFLILYDRPGRAAEIALAAQSEPHVDGDTSYVYWDRENESAVIGVRFEEDEKILAVNNYLLVVLAPRERALRTWIADFARFPGRAGLASASVPFISDAALLVSNASEEKRIRAEFEFPPGSHNLTAMLPRSPARCRVDGKATELRHDGRSRTTRLSFSTPELPYKPISITSVRTWTEEITGQQAGKWLTSPLRPLEQLGRVPYGYVKYRSAPFVYRNENKMFISTFGDDRKKVFLNGELVPEASITNPQVEFDLTKRARRGNNTLEISYEAFGSPNYGDNLGELMGLKSVRLGEAAQSAAPLGPWQIQGFPAPAQGRGKIDPEQAVGGWNKPVAIGTGGDPELLPVFTWCRAEFEMPELAEGWFAPWKVILEAGRDALLYLNGRFVGRYMTIGPQKDFYLPEPYLIFGQGKKNVLTLVLAYTRQAGQIRTLRVAPFAEFATRLTRVEFEWYDKGLPA